jgi:nitrate/nitrite-specific signal transduction histidine kinase
MVAPQRDVAPAEPVLAALDAAVRGIANLAAIDDVLQVIVDRVRPLVSAQYAALGIVDDEGRIERFITSGLDDETRRAIGQLPKGRGLLGLIIHENRSFRIPDINQDPRRYGFPPNHPPMTSFLGVPITYGGESVGRLYLTNKIGAGEFTTQDQAVVETFALHAGIAMANVRHLEQLRALAVADERQRISRDLHDGIIQNLYAVGLSLEGVADQLEDEAHDAATRVGRAIDSIHVAIGDIRNFIVGLRPTVVSGVPLASGLNSIADDLRPHTVVKIAVALGDPLVEPPPEVTGHLLAIAGEALSNVIRHSRATEATLSVESPTLEPPAWRLVVEDNGAGFDPGAAARHGHQGLENMRDRAEAVGGALTIESRIMGGTRVIVRVPASTEDRSEGT